ncbi:hypothetical protein NIG5292_00823 [Nereida ignava]|uniref:Uncharacterized protein n=1 Tax=Nereida ignava TaxID=282199 RepID=A0A0U1NJ65_9RHOB|nr:hypothetical protein NIG5292_00823 [Nereida ignava]
MRSGAENQDQVTVDGMIEFHAAFNSLPKVPWHG